MAGRRAGGKQTEKQSNYQAQVFSELVCLGLWQLRQGGRTKPEKNKKEDLTTFGYILASPALP